ncbi:porphobilinogen synthase [Afifella marina]|uniref:Delta-aminolevulinic acid dehydratase n=1 Tax=Afifella marina DSM 2698 TaxID=1120955 RepID=A0A1G5MKW2_AFIMA|nr:porphobilinogen synthase [Afifella marina]MBK1623867.1 porphobilinogen synthase [Afifella marina DSM 2698]MBK1627217.1 porphobilinogen synthase [Afifella marina]MBK5918754.1 delta-aminolevulinic acid dehydratase [Afifella marina]RAI22637.1 delta-aminolevulinic acid dehydratase [Afifella marina DSM 2698]SCZ25742.1 porphobilinogen synthase [Afifella marina DSM 2698]
MSAIFPLRRQRRLRHSAPLRSLVQETHISANDLIYPLLVEEGISEPVAIPTMPGIHRVPEKSLAREINAIAEDGVKAVILFGISHHKDAEGSDTWNPDGLMARMVASAKREVPELVVITDNCFCEYTDHGHCGVYGPNGVDNDATLENLARQALVAVEAGADMVAPSAMMDGQIAAIRRGLDEGGHPEAPILAYSSKFASAFYGPFRAAAGCDLVGDRRAYQMDPANGREALLESLIDEAEAADMLMVKPGLPYLDVLTRLRERTLLPLVCYQVGGEYAMIRFAADADALNEAASVHESLLAMKRAGADLIISYYARQALREGWVSAS